MASDRGRDEEWLRTFEPFGGYFENSDLNDGGEFARIVRCLVEDEPFVRATIDITEAFFEFGRDFDLESEPGLLAALRRVTDERGRRCKWAELVERLVLDALAARAEFERLPKRTPSQHKAHYLAIAEKAEGLRKAIAEEVTHGDYYGLGDRDIAFELEQIAESAMEAAKSPRLSRPRADRDDEALRTHVAREISGSFLRHTDGFRHAAAASLLNAVFPNAEVKDAGYMQSIARKLDRDP